MSSNNNKVTSDTVNPDNNPDFDPLSAALRRMHDGIVNEVIPEDFLILLDQIDAKMSAHKKFR